MPTIPDVLEPIGDCIRNTLLPTLSTVCQGIVQLFANLFAFLAGFLDNMRGSEAMNRLLMFMGVCNFFLLWAAWSVWNMPTMGFGIVFSAIVSSAHTGFVWGTVHKHQFVSRLLERYSSPFLIGLIVGLTIMMIMLALVMAVFFGNVVRSCTKPDQSEEFECYYGHKFAMRSVSFFETLLFFANGILAGLFLNNGEEMEWSSNQYENLDTPGVDSVP